MTLPWIQAHIESITPLTDSILQLMIIPDHYVDYRAGQYLQIRTPNDAMSYSIANAPLGAHKYELHIRHSQDNAHNQQWLSDIKKNGTLFIRLPMGNCHIAGLDTQQPILFLAVGTGFAPIKAMIEQLLANGDARRFELFWGARSHSDLYMDDKARYWLTHVSHFQYFGESLANNKSALLHTVLQQHPTDLKQWQIVLSGPFDMVFDLRDQLIANGALPDRLFSDAFEGEI